MRALTFCALSLALTACGEEGPPSTYSIHPDTPDWQAETIRAAIDEWCDVAGLCPEEVEWGSLGGRMNSAILVLEDYRERPRVGGSDAIHWESTNDIWFSPEAASDQFKLYVSTLHEVGHWCLREHVSDSPLMTGRAIPQSERYFGAIDKVAVDSLSAACAPFLISKR